MRTTHRGLCQHLGQGGQEPGRARWCSAWSRDRAPGTPRIIRLPDVVPVAYLESLRAAARPDAPAALAVGPAPHRLRQGVRGADAAPALELIVEIHDAATDRSCY
ncbi:MAG: hypothetical protein U0263_39765 [Polyangiaceae bacterium]